MPKPNVIKRAAKKTINKPNKPAKKEKKKPVVQQEEYTIAALHSFFLDGKGQVCAIVEWEGYEGQMDHLPLANMKEGRPINKLIAKTFLEQPAFFSADVRMQFEDNDFDLEAVLAGEEEGYSDDDNGNNNDDEEGEMRDEREDEENEEEMEPHEEQEEAAAGWQQPLAKVASFFSRMF